MWFDDMDIGGHGLVLPAVGPLGQAMRGVRHDLWMSQAQLAATVGVAQSAVSRLELGAPNWRLFCKVLEAVGGRPVVTVERTEALRERMMEAHPWHLL